MTRKLLAVGSLLCLVALTSQGADDKKTDKDKLQGTWILTARVENGSEYPPVKEVVSISFEGDKFASHSPDKKDDEDGTFALDEQKHTIDLRKQSKNDPKVTTTILEIYSLDGDTLKIGILTKDENGKRPMGFDEKDCMIFMFKRMTK